MRPRKPTILHYDSLPSSRATVVGPPTADENCSRAAFVRNNADKEFGGGNRPTEFSTTVEKLVEKATNLNRVARKRRFLQGILQAKTCQAPYTRRLHTVVTGKTRLLRAAEKAPLVGRN